MKFLNALFKRQLVGLDIGVSGIKAVEIVRGKNPKLLAYNRVPFPWDTLSPDGEIKRRDWVVAALKKLFQTRQFSTKKVAVGAFGNGIITKKITVPKMSISELEHQLYWEAEQYIPFEMSEVNLDFAVLGTHNSSSGKPMMDVLLVAAKKEYIETLRSLVEEAGLDAQVIDSQVFALGNAYEFNYDSSHINGAATLIDFGAGSTKISIFDEDKTVFTREIRQSGIGCSEHIMERLGVALTEAERLKLEEPKSEQVKPLIDEYLFQLVEEIGRSLELALLESTDLSIGGLYICGGGSRLIGLKKVLEERVSVPVHELSPIRNIMGSGNKMNPKVLAELSYLGAVAMGLALRTTGERK